jgi:predicted pyridoxine 5'-phosphate oxidase superfamily flavin-nucleotide-binding protein
MTTNPDNYFIHDLASLEALFDRVGEASIKKEVSHRHHTYQAMIAASPFAVLATVGPDGLDVSPRGDPPGFGHIQDEHTLCYQNAEEITGLIVCETLLLIRASLCFF